ncbi:hypothetical protein D3C72_2077940 [compost metagenome]
MALGEGKIPAGSMVIWLPDTLKRASGGISSRRSSSRLKSLIMPPMPTSETASRCGKSSIIPSGPTLTSLSMVMGTSRPNLRTLARRIMRSPEMERRASLRGEPAAGRMYRPMSASRLAALSRIWPSRMLMT